MTELAESVMIGLIADSGDVPCPFDHDAPAPEKVNNQLVGNGGTLGSCMEAGSGTTLYPPLKRKLRPVPYPEQAEREVTVGEHSYPVWCAAHHLIPAQASLKKATQLKRFMEKGRGPSKLWSDIGYDVNGLQNGVWLPGNYAVGGMGTGDWVGAPSAMDGDAEEGSVRRRAARRSASSTKLDGLRHEIDPDNRKWLYVDKATRLVNAQFHDAHVDYNKFVLGILNKIGASLQERKKKNLDGLACRKCAKREEKIAEYGIPPPFSLIKRLDGVSARLRSYLKGRRGHAMVFTSRWGKLIGKG